MAQTDELGHHEALHTAYIMARMWSDFVEDHATVAGNPELKAKAEQISEGLNAFYQAVGRLKP